MTDDQSFRKIVEGDLGTLRFVLKNKIASFEEIKRQEESLISSIKGLMTSIKELEEVLSIEVEQYKKLSGGWEKAYRQKRWDALGTALRTEVERFNQEYTKTKDLYQLTQTLTQRFNTLLTLLQKMNISNTSTRDADLKLLQDFRNQKATLI